MREGGGSEAGDGPSPGDINSLNQVRDRQYISQPPPHEDIGPSEEVVF